MILFEKDEILAATGIPIVSFPNVDRPDRACSGGSYRDLISKDRNSNDLFKGGSIYG